MDLFRFINNQMEEYEVTLEWFKQIKGHICEAEDHGLLLECQDLSGFSGLKLIGALQRIATEQENSGNGHYMEVGVFQGLTLVSVASCLKSSTAYGIDNFAHHDPDGENQRIVNKRAAANNIDSIDLINLDYEDALENLKKYIGDRTIGTYFVDGPHDYRSQLMCLQLARPFLSRMSVIIVDDSNYRHVRLANRDFLVSNPDFKLLFESYTRCHPGNMTSEEVAQARLGWWNGVNIMVHDPENILDPMLPATHRDRTLYENDHLVHGQKYAEITPEIVSFAQYLASFRLFSAAKCIVKIFRKRKNTNDSVRDRYQSLNTYSENLPNGRFNSRVVRHADSKL